VTLTHEHPRADDTPDDDVALVDRARACDRRAFEAIMRRHNQRLFRVARAILKDDHEAEDAVQEAYVSAFQGIAGFEGRSRLSTWLVRIVVNEALGRRRHQLVMAPTSEINDMAGDGTRELFGLLSVAEDPEKAAARADIRRLLEAAIDALPEIFRTVFVLRAVEMLSVEETASSLGIPEATVKTRFHRARRQLRLHLEDRLGSALAGTFPFAGARCDRIVAAVLARLDVD
jgi:RNA polymerase sigma-70 factor (ECF subfamily)